MSKERVEHSKGVEWHELGVGDGSGHVLEGSPQWGAGCSAGFLHGVKEEKWTVEGLEAVTGPSLLCPLQPLSHP